MKKISDIQLLAQAMNEFATQNHKEGINNTSQCIIILDAVGEIPKFRLEGVDAMKANFGNMPSFNFDGEKLIYKDNPDMVILVEIE